MSYKSYPRQCDEYFIITSLHREDFAAQGFDATALSDQEMKQCAKNMANVYLECDLFWEGVRQFAEMKKLPPLAIPGKA